LNGLLLPNPCRPDNTPEREEARIWRWKKWSILFERYEGIAIHRRKTPVLEHRTNYTVGDEDTAQDRMV
jgi:hypothetical protein